MDLCFRSFHSKEFHQILIKVMMQILILLQKPALQNVPNVFHNNTVPNAILAVF